MTTLAAPRGRRRRRLAAWRHVACWRQAIPRAPLLLRRFRLRNLPRRCRCRRRCLESAIVLLLQRTVDSTVLLPRAARSQRTIRQPWVTVLPPRLGHLSVRYAATPGRTAERVSSRSSFFSLALLHPAREPSTRSPFTDRCQKHAQSHRNETTLHVVVTRCEKIRPQGTNPAFPKQTRESQPNSTDSLVT